MLSGVIDMGIEYILGLPLILIFAVSVLVIITDAFSKQTKINFGVSILGLLAVAASGVYTLTMPPEKIAEAYLGLSMIENPGGFNLLNMITVGGYAAFFDVLFCLAGVLTILAARPYIQREYKEYNEFYSLIIFSVSGMMFIAHANSFLMLFLGVEIMSITFYIMAGYFRLRIRSVEAALKYFLLGAFATGFLLYGMALIYGATGTINIGEIATKVQSGVGITPVFMTIGLGLLIIGLSFKVAAFPFHQWAPDVYNGSPTVVTGFMSTAGKAAALIGFIIVGKALIDLDNPNEAIVSSSETSQMIIAIISAATMLIGNITALVQTNVKRMLSYSSVAHAGYLLMGIVAANTEGWNGILFYSTAYMFMQIGAFVIVSILEKDDSDYLEIKDYAGLSKRHPALAAMMAIFMFSLAGIPPMAGFFGKYYLFRAAITADFTWLTIIAVISSIISMYFYIGLIVQMYFKDKEEAGEERKLQIGVAGYALVLSTIGILLFGILPSLIVDITEKFF